MCDIRDDAFSMVKGLVDLSNFILEQVQSAVKIENVTVGMLEKRSLEPPFCYVFS